MSDPANLTPDSTDALREKIIKVLKTVFDPEIPVNIYDLGLVYKVEPSPDGDVKVTMTLTSPNCPEVQTLPADIEYKIANTEGVRSAKVDLVWEPPWTPDFMTEAAKLELGMF